MAYTKTWQFVPNYVPDSSSASNLCKNVIWFWSRMLLGDQTALTFKDSTGATIAGGSVSGKWFVWGSTDGGGTNISNGGTSGSPATDYWTSTFTASKIVQNTAGNNHSWIVLGSPSNFGGTGVGPFYVIIDCNSATTTQVSVYLCKTAPNVNGTATARPTSTDEVPLESNPATFLATTTTTHHLSGILSTDGIMRVFQSRDSVALFSSYFGVEAFADALSGDLWPAALCLYHIAAPSVGTAASAVLAFPTTGVNISTFATINTNAMWRGRSADGTTITRFMPSWLGWTTNTSDTKTRVDANYAANPQSGKWDNIPFYGIWGTPGDSLGYRGRLYDVGIAMARKSSATLVMGDGTFDDSNGWMVVGDTWQPAIAAHVM